MTKDKQRKGQKTKIQKDKNTKAKSKTKKSVRYCDVRAVSHSCNVFVDNTSTLPSGQLVVRPLAGRIRSGPQRDTWRQNNYSCNPK